MRFRPCIDIHAGEVKQIVGLTLTDETGKGPVTNFVSSQSAGDFARYVARIHLKVGHSSHLFWGSILVIPFTVNDVLVAAIGCTRETD